MPGKYDDARFNTRQQISFGISAGISVPGTAASATELLRIPITGSLTIDRLRIIAMTGGTAAGPTLTINKSLGGTGAVAPFGTNAFGTNADNAQFSVTLGTANTLVAGDALVIRNEAGTAASTPKIVLSVGYVETYPQ